MGILPGVLDHLNDGINVVNADGILIYVNEISANYVNQTRGSMLGRPITDFYPDAVLPFYKTASRYWIKKYILFHPKNTLSIPTLFSTMGNFSEHIPFFRIFRKSTS